MKTAILILISFNGHLFGQKNLDSLQLHGNVKSIHEITSQLAHTKDKNKSVILDSTHYLFNKNGYLTKEIESKIGTGCRFIRAYNPNGFLTEAYCRLCGIEDRKEYVYDENQQLIKIIDHAILKIYTHIEYNESNQLIKEEYQDSSTLVSDYKWKVKEYKYDEMGNLSLQSTKIAADIDQHFLYSAFIYFRYDSLNRLKSTLKEEFSDSKTSYWEKATFAYNEFNLLIHETITVSDSSETDLDYEYTNGYLTRVQRKMRSFVKAINGIEETFLENKYSYDQNGNMIYLKEGAFEEWFEYVYDDFNNWIKKTILVDGKEIFVIERKIRYYK